MAASSIVGVADSGKEGKDCKDVHVLLKYAKAEVRRKGPQLGEAVAEGKSRSKSRGRSSSSMSVVLRLALA